MIPVEAVEAAAKALAIDRKAEHWFSEEEWEGIIADQYKEPYRRKARAALEAAAPYMQQEVDLMRWKLNALSKWADAMIDESYYPQYGRDVKTILDVSSIEETKEDFGDD